MTTSSNRWGPRLNELRDAHYKLLNELRLTIRRSLSLLSELESGTDFWRWVVVGSVLYALIGVALAPHPSSLEEIPYNVLVERLTVQAAKPPHGKDRIASIHSSATFLRAELADGAAVVAIRPPFDDPSLAALLRQAHVDVKSPHAFGWDVVAAATAFATLSAVLAGFAFVAILAILTVRPKKGHHATKSVLALIQAFLALVVAALLFSLLAGDVSGRESISPDISAYAATWLLAMGIVQMGVAIAWLMHDYDLWSYAVHHATWWLVTFTVLVAAGGTASVLVTPSFALQPVLWSWNSALWIWATLPFWVGGVLWRKWAPNVDAVSALDRLTLLSVMAVAGATTAAALVAVPNEILLHNPFVYGGIVFLAFLGQCVIATLVAVYQATMPKFEPPSSTAPMS